MIIRVIRYRVVHSCSNGSNKCNTWMYIHRKIHLLSSYLGTKIIFNFIINDFSCSMFFAAFPTSSSPHYNIWTPQTDARSCWMYTYGHSIQAYGEDSGRVEQIAEAPPTCTCVQWNHTLSFVTHHHHYNPVSVIKSSNTIGSLCNSSYYSDTSVWMYAWVYFFSHMFSIRMCLAVGHNDPIQLAW